MQVRWITFHSGYDFGYLLKLLTCSSLPTNEGEFFQLLKVGLPKTGVSSGKGRLLLLSAICSVSIGSGRIQQQQPALSCSCSSRKSLTSSTS